MTRADDELFEILGALEALAVVRSIRGFTCEQLHALEAAYLEFQCAEPDEMLDRHRDFDRALFAAAGQRLARLISDMSEEARIIGGRPFGDQSDAERRDNEGLVYAAIHRDTSTAIQIIQTRAHRRGVRRSSR